MSGLDGHNVTKPERIDSVKYSVIGYIRNIDDEMFKVVPTDIMALCIAFFGPNHMPWYKGFEIKRNENTLRGYTLLDALEAVPKLSGIPKRRCREPFRMPISEVYRIKGVGLVCCGRVEQGQISKGMKIQYCPPRSWFQCHNTRTPCGSVSSIQVHGQRGTALDVGRCGDNIGICIKDNAVTESTYFP